MSVERSSYKQLDNKAKKTDSFLTIKEASFVSAYSVAYITRLAQQGKISAKKIDNQWFVDKDSLNKFVAETLEQKEMLKDRLRLERLSNIKNTEKKQPIKSAEVYRFNVDEPVLKTSTLIQSLVFVLIFGLCFGFGSIYSGAVNNGISANEALAGSYNAVQSNSRNFFCTLTPEVIRKALDICGDGVVRKYAILPIESAIDVSYLTHGHESDSSVIVTHNYYPVREVVRETIINNDSASVDSSNFITRSEYNNQVDALLTSIENNSGTTVINNGGGNTGATNLEDLTDVATMTKSAGDLFTWNGTSWTNIATSSLGIVGSGAVDSVNGQTGAVVLTTSNLSEGSNLYFTNGRAITALTGQNISLFNNDAGYLTSIPSTYLQSGDNISELTNDAGYLTSFTELDPIFSSSVASSIDNIDISNWNTAYSWGNHADAGYLTSISTSTIRGMFSATSPIQYNPTTGEFTFTGTGGGVSAWGDLTGNLSDQTDLQTALNAKYDASNPNGYTNNTGTVTSVAMSVPTGFTITNSPITTNGTLALGLATGYTIPLSASTTEWTNAYIATQSLNSSSTVWDSIANLVNTNYSNWNTAYSWGDHSTAGYLTSIPSTYLQSGDNVSELANDAGYLTTISTSTVRGMFASGTGLAYDSITGTYTNTGVTSIGGLTGDISTSSLGLPTFADLTDFVTETSTSSNLWNSIAGIVNSNYANWNESYGWGNHATEGYLKNNDNATFNSLTINSLNDGCVEVSDGLLTSTGVNCGTGSGGLVNLNGLTSTSQSFATTSNNGLTLSVVSSGSVHTFSPNVATGYTIPLSASTTEWTNAYIATQSLNSSSTVWDSIANLVNTNYSNWNIAYSWGNHATAGYLTSIPSTYLQSGDNISELTNDAGYLTSFTELDPIFSSSVASSIDNTDISNWNTAYSWGNHADAGYLTSVPSSYLQSGDNVSELTNDAGYLTSIPSTYLQSGDNVSELANDAGYLTTISTSTVRGMFASGTGLAYDSITGTYTNTGVTSIGGLTGDISTSSLGIISTESDPIFSASTAYGINNTDLAHWNAAYAWGDHSTAGYLVASNNLSDLTDTADARTNLGLGSLATLNDLSTFTTSNLSEGSNLYFTNGRAITALTGQNISLFNNDAGYLTTISTSTVRGMFASGTGLAYDSVTGTYTNTGVTSIGGLTGDISTSSLGIKEGLWSANGNVAYYNNGNVGIGTDSPSARLTIADSATFGPELITNGSFDDDADGWELESGCAFWNDGMIDVLLDDNCENDSDWPAVHTDVDLVSGTKYMLTFDMVPNGDEPYVYFDELTLNTVPVSDTLIFTSDYTGTDTLTLESNRLSKKPSGWSIDNVSLREITYDEQPLFALKDLTGATTTLLGLLNNNVAIGKGALEGVTASHVIGIGVNAGSGATGASNSNFIGYYAGQGANNVSDSNFFGTSAGSGATNAADSNFLGYNAGSGATSANYSNFFGYLAGRNAAHSYSANFLGYNAGQNATNANNSNFLGYNAGFDGINANYSNFLGSSAGSGASEAHFSNFFGTEAGRDATNANYSNFFGTSAGRNATNANYSNFFGQQAGYGATNAANSIFIGNFSGSGDTVNNTINDGTSIAIGNYSGTGGFSNSIALGRGVINSATRQLNIGNVLYATGIYASNTRSSTPTNGMFGIGTSTPSSRLTVAGDAYITGAFRDSTNSAGTSGQVLSSTGSGTTWITPNYLTEISTSTILGMLSAGTGLSYTSGQFSLNASLNDLNDVDATTTPAIGDLLSWNGTSWVNIATSSLGISSSLWNQNGNDISYTAGNVGIGTDSPSARLTIADSATFGPELITNGSFDDDADGWVLPSGCATWDDGAVTVLYDETCSNDTNDANITTDVELVSGTKYLLTFDMVSNGDRPYVYSDNAGVYFEYGNVLIFTSNYTGTDTITFESWNHDSDTGWTIDDVSLREITYDEQPLFALKDLTGATTTLIGLLNNNVAIGRSALEGVTASNVTGIGVNAGSGATNAYYSNFLGFDTGSGAINAYDSNFLGSSAGYGATGAHGSNFFGPSAGYGATGADNSNFFGLSAGQNATNAPYSNFFGLSAGQNATNASNSNFLGYYAGTNAVDAYYSNFFGPESGYNAYNANNSNFLGVYAGNVAANAYRSNFFGSHAGDSATDARDSNFFGSYAGSGATSANNSNFFGFGAGDGATDAHDSNFFGNGAGDSATDARDSNFLGRDAGSGAFNAIQSNFFGSSAGNGATYANDSNFFGVSTGQNATNAYSSNFFGYQSGYGAVNAFESNFFGVEAGKNAVEADESNFLGSEAGSSATNASYSNFLGSEAGYQATNASYANFLGSYAGYQATNAVNSIFIGSNAGSNDTVNNTTNGGTSIAIGQYSGTGGFSDSIALGHGVINSATRQLNIGNVLYATGIYASNTQSASPTNGMFGIGTSTPSSRLTVAGDAYITGAFRDSLNNAGTAGQLLSSTATGTAWITPTYLTEVSTSTIRGMFSATSPLSYNSATGDFSLGTIDISSSTNLAVSATGLALTGDTITLASGYSIPTTTNVSNWNTAYSWGNHAAAGYLTSVTGESFYDLSDTPTAGATRNNRILYQSGSSVIDSADLTFNGTTLSAANIQTPGKLSIGTSTATSLINMASTFSTPTAQLIAGIDQRYNFTMSGGGNQFGNYLGVVNAPTGTTSNTMLASLISVTDNTTLGNIVRGLEVQTANGTNTAGENTAISAFARTFGLKAITEGDAGGLFEPAAVFAQTRGTTQGNAIRAYSENITSGTLVSLLQRTSNFSGTGLAMDFSTSTSGFTGNFIKLTSGGTDRFVITANGSVGIGTTTPSAQLTTTGTVRFANFGAGTLQTDANGNLLISSDMNLKDKVGDFNRGLEDILKIEPILYQWKVSTGFDTETTYAGFSAQNIQDAITEAVGYNADGTLTLTDRPILAASINAIKELNLKLEDLATTTDWAHLDEDSFTNKFFHNLISWFADKANGIGDFFAGRIITNEICIGDESNRTCLDKSQLDELLQEKSHSDNHESFTQGGQNNVENTGNITDANEDNSNLEDNDDHNNDVENINGGEESDEGQSVPVENDDAKTEPDNSPAVDSNNQNGQSDTNNHASQNSDSQNNNNSNSSGETGSQPTSSENSNNEGGGVGD